MDDSAKALAHKDKGNEHFKAKRYKEAIEEYSKAIELDPAAPAYYGNRAFAYIKTEAYGAALEDASSAIKLDRNFVKAYYRRATANMALGKFKLSLKDYKAVLKVKPNDKDAQKKCRECEKIVKRLAFEAAIAVEDKSARSAYDIITESVASMAVDSKYKGPQLGDKITIEYVKELMEHFKTQGKLHTKHAYQILLWAHDLLKSLPSLVDVAIPEGKHITICGDVHGQYYDVMNIFEMNGLPSETNPYLFNGDFVDRGSFSVEVIFVFLCFRLLYPNHFHMTRGNHETETLNKIYGFEGEVKAKFNPRMMELFTEVYQWLPLGHVVNGKVLCVHGGLFSQDGVKLDDIRAVARNRQPPDSGIMCEILWADPQDAPGRGPSKRGTGVQFGPDITKKFLDDNGLDLLIRSHEVKDNGYEVAHDGKCITIFSAPNYCDSMGNKGAFITLKEDLVPKYTTFAAVPHPDVKAMAYAGMMGGF